MKNLFIALALTAALPAATALAQEAWVEIDDDSAMVAAMNMSVDDLEDMDVYTAGGEEIGEVEEVLGTTTGEAQALVLEVGGFLGIGDRDVIVPLDKLSMQDNRLVLDMSAEEIKALEDWND